MKIDGIKIKLTELKSTDNYQTFLNLLKELSTIDIDQIPYEDYLKHLQLIQQNPLHKIYVAKINDKIIGTITLFIEPKFIHNLSYVGHIEDVVVDKQYRGIGLGSFLLKKVIKNAYDNNCYKVILDCSNKNIAFYEKNGFKQKENHMVKYYD